MRRRLLRSLVRAFCCFFFSSRRRHTRCLSDWSSDVCSSDLCPWPHKTGGLTPPARPAMPPERLIEALERLVQLYEATGKKDEAAKWRAKLEERSEERRVGKECRSRWWRYR